MSGRIVAVDVGNSAVKICLRGSQGWNDYSLQEYTVEIDQPDWHCKAVGWVQQHSGNQAALWRIASVHQAAAEKLHQAIDDSDSAATIQLITRGDIPMQLRIDHPDRLGIDRLVGAYAAHKRFGGSLVVVDAGSAITVDWVDAEGDFCGGAILPGITMQLRALASGTDALPKIQCDHDWQLVAPAKNTADAIRLGVKAGTAAGIDQLARHYGREAGVTEQDYRMVVTGGDAAVISGGLAHSAKVVENLVCRGLLDLPRSTVTETNTEGELE